jgi:histidinol-phosphate phosphatase family protein
VTAIPPKLSAVFLDRDDTVIHCNELPAPPPPGKRGDHVHPQLVSLLPGALEACAALKQAGFRLVVFSNQGAVARGVATLSLVEEIHDRMRDLLLAPAIAGASPRSAGADTHATLIDAVYYCPFHPEGLVPRFTREHEWRKPAPGMIRAAADELHLDLSRSWLIGDAPRDVEAGINAGLPPKHCLLVRPVTLVPDIASAARMILRSQS